MRSLRFRLFLVLVLASLAACAARSPISALPAPWREIAVVVRPEANGIRASYRSPHAARVFRFGKDGAEIRKDTWRALGAGLTLTGDELAAASPVSGFDLTIAPDSKQRDRIYPALSRVGEGWLIYAPHLRIQGESLPLHLSIEVPPGWKVIGRRDTKGALVGDGYIFAGPSSLVHRGAADVIGSPSTPDWLLREIAGSASGTVAFYANRLASDLDAPEASTAADILLHVSDAQRWSSFASAAQRYGAEIVQARRADDGVVTLTRVLALHCGPHLGFFTFPDRLKLDTGTHCGPLNGNPDVDSVAGFDPIAQPSATNDKVREICTSGGLVEFAFKGNVVARARCTQPLPPVTLGWQIREGGTGVF